MMLTVAELPEYLRRASKLFDDDERRAVVDYLATRPKAGVLIEGTGGVRKLRWGRGARVRAAVCVLCTTSIARTCRCTC